MLAFWNDGSPRIIRNTRHVVMPNGDVRLNAKPDPDNDLYEFAPGVKPGAFQTIAARSYSNDGWTVTETNTLSYRAIEDIRAARISRMKAQAFALLSPDDWMAIRELEDPGTPIPTDVKARREAIRRQSNDFEAAVNAETDPAAAAAMQPDWPADPRENNGEGA